VKKRRIKKNKDEKPKDDVILLEELVQLEDIRGGFRRLTFGEGVDPVEDATSFGVGTGKREGINKKRGRRGSE
jgi:hypothetical protein